MTHTQEYNPVVEELIQAIKTYEPLKELWMTPEELEKELGITISAQTRMRAERKIPFYKIGKFIKYNKQEISEWIKSHKVEVIE